MKELSLNILDIAENSTKAGATLVEITLQETEETLTITVKDNGHGMSAETCKAALDPFYTTRTTRSVGMGIPLFKMMAEQTGGSLTLLSKSKQEYGDESGTITSAMFYKNHIDAAPLGDIVETMVTLIQCNPDTEFKFLHKTEEKTIKLETSELKAVLGDVPLNNIEVILWIKQYLIEQYKQ